jgi:hypothetical protein
MNTEVIIEKMMVVVTSMGPIEKTTWGAMGLASTAALLHQREAGRTPDDNTHARREDRSRNEMLEARECHAEQYQAPDAARRHEYGPVRPPHDQIDRESEAPEISHAEYDPSQEWWSPDHSRSSRRT